MSKTKSQQEQSLFNYLADPKSKHPITMRDLVNKLHISKSDLLEIIKPYKKTDSNPLGLINVKKVGNTKHYSLEVTAYDQLHEHIPLYIEGISNMIKHHITNLNKEKPLFKDVTFKELDNQGTTLSFKLSSNKARDILENISLLLSDIISKSFLITYYKTLNQIPPNKTKQADKDQELCIKTFSNILTKLRTIVGRRKNHQKALDDYLFKHAMIIKRLDLKS